MADERTMSAVTMTNIAQRNHQKVNKHEMDGEDGVVFELNDVESRI